MSEACLDPSGDSDAIHQNAAASVAASRLALAASPTFALMALLTSAGNGGSAGMLCSTQDVSALSGMPAMYLLMSAFRAGPWLKLIRAVLTARA
jgi:hypothetical protein